MKVNVSGLAENHEYDERNLVFSLSHKHRYPSKKMFAEFLKGYKDVEGTAEIWAQHNLQTGVVIITVELSYKLKDMEDEKA